MDNLAGIAAFVQAAETGSFVGAGSLLGVSASAVGKSIARLEARIGIRLFHRSTRSITLTAEGQLFLQRCQRILGELSAAEQELSEVRAVPRGKLRVSLPSMGALLNPLLANFVATYPDIELDADFTDRRVDLIEEGFDAVVRIGGVGDSRLSSRQLGNFELQLVASPAYLKDAATVISTSSDLAAHSVLLYKFPNSGKIEHWPVLGWQQMQDSGFRSCVVCNTVDTLIYMAEHGRGVACLPDFAVRTSLAEGRLQRVPVATLPSMRTFTILWPSSKYLAPKVRVFIDLLANSLFPEQH